MCEGIFLLLMFIGMVKEESRRRPRPLRARTEQWNWTQTKPAFLGSADGTAASERARR